MDKLYERILFEDDTAPDLSAAIMNSMSKAIDDIDNRVIEIAPEDLVLQLHDAQEVLERSEALLADIEQNIDVIKQSAQSASTNANRAEQAAEEASQYVVEPATLSKAGVVKPDGTTTTVDEDGTIHAVGGGGGTSDYSALANKPKINNVELSGDKTSSDLGLLATSDKAELNSKGENINVYVGDDGKIHFTDWAGADSVLPFSGGKANLISEDHDYKFSSAAATLNANVNYLYTADYAKKIIVFTAGWTDTISVPITNTQEVKVNGNNVTPYVTWNNRGIDKMNIFIFDVVPNDVVSVDVTIARGNILSLAAGYAMFG